MTRPGRPRSAQIDARVLQVTREQLARLGYAGLSLTRVADAAGTTRPALYRRWPSKASLATAAIADLSRADERPATEDPLADLVAELAAFRAGVSRPDGISMIGTMLSAGTDPDLVAEFRRRVVAPRRRRLRAILRRGREAGLLAPGADIDVAVTTLTGSWYAYALAGDPPPSDWAERVARHTWRGLGGAAP